MGLAEEPAGEDQDRPVADPRHAVRGVYVEHVELLFGLINDRLAAVFEANRRDRFNREVVPLLRAGKLPSAPTEEEVLAYGRETDSHLEAGRKREHEWAAWDAGAKHFSDACEASTELIAALRQGIGAAEQHQAERKNKLLGRGGLIVGVLGLAAAVIALVA